MTTFTTIPHKHDTLPDGRQIDIDLMDEELRKTCHYVKYVTFYLKDEKNVVAVIFPDEDLLKKPDYLKTPEEGCFCPRNLKELGKCLCGCTCTVNLQLPFGYARIDNALIIQARLTVEDGTLTPEGIPVPEQILKKYGNHLLNLYGTEIPVKEDVFAMNFNE